MNETEILLGFDPTDAIVRMVNLENNTNFIAEYLDVSIPTALTGPDEYGVEGRRTQVAISVRDVRGKLDDVPYPSGSINFVYKRLFIDMQFGDTLALFRPTFPTTTQTLLDEITRITGQAFFPEDFILEVITKDTALPYVLKAKPESWRWIGTLEVTLADPVDLSTYLLDGIPQNLGQIPQGIALGDLNLSAVHVNGTPEVTRLTEVPASGAVTSGSAVGDFLLQVLPRVRQTVAGNAVQWRFSTHVADVTRNLQDAQLVAKALPYDASIVYDYDRSTLFSHVMEVTLDPARNTDLTEHLIQIPYRLAAGYEPTEFAARSRLIQNSATSLTNGSAYLSWINGLTVGGTVSSGPASLSLTGNDLWVIDSAAPAAYNLYGATVVYRGPRRSYDLPAADGTLTHLLVLRQSDYNLTYRGDVNIHYKP